MSTAMVYNGLGGYDEKDGKLGIMLMVAATPFFLPFEEVTYLPNWNFRELDHAKSTPEVGQVGEAIYQNVIVSGEKLAAQLTRLQIPISNYEQGIITIKGKPTGKTIQVFAGYTADEKPERIMADVQEVEPTKAERELAAANAESYKRTVIAEFFQSKRQKMHGGTGRLIPCERERLYMEELQVEDIDDVTTHQKAAGGIDPEMIKLIIEETRQAGEVNTATLREAIATVRRSGNEARVAPAKPKSLNLAEKKAQWEAEHPEEVVEK